ncbi:MAG: UvrB/UvrC motif-containing protein [Planctomycetota bacterium]
MSVLCERCSTEKATVIATCIYNGETTKRSLCQACYDDEGLALPIAEAIVSEFKPLEPIAKIELKLVKSAIDMVVGDGEDETDASLDRVCPQCGMTLAEFKTRRVVGCAHDYEVFADELRDLLLRLHGGREHRGKVPLDIEMQRIREHRVQQLAGELERAIDSEHYEEAARLRDRIQALKQASVDGDS